MSTFIDDDFSFVPETQELETPPTPPIHQDPGLSTVHQEIKTLMEKLEQLENQLESPPQLVLIGIENLKKETGRNWEDRLSYLMFSAHIPLGWILDTIPEENKNPNVVKLSFISVHVQRRVLKLLNDFLANDYKNIVYIE